ncbi:MAG: type II toxin-antitoxin system VapB family antitoxin [Acidobacteria bacterium]|nr:type II toxin-antitoxin system VapB family antitoxin [Acidobacteriota bacterium]MBI3281029.1 type II toxin-antitoxin system VapB family antitoxin [Acidobacteriota bacterium]
MKRTSLVLDRRLLADAMSVLGAKTYSEAVNEALREIVRIHKVQGLARYFGKGLWEGDLSEMRGDRRMRCRKRR